MGQLEVVVDERRIIQRAGREVDSGLILAAAQPGAGQPAQFLP